jgi:hypothetical protein
MVDAQAAPDGLYVAEVTLGRSDSGIAYRLAGYSMSRPD